MPCREMKPSRRFHAYIGTGPLVLLKQEAMDEPESGTDSEVEPGAEEEPASETESEVEPEGVAVPEPASETESVVEPKGAAGPQAGRAPGTAATAEANENSAGRLMGDTANMEDPKGDSKRKKDLEDNIRARLEEEELTMDETVEK